jgi:hypothetical protein
VLSAILDRKQGIVSPPESAFPQVLGAVSDKERADRRLMAALYLQSTFVPTPLNLEEAATCMEGSNEEILITLGKAVAVKLGRNSGDVKSVIWKTPRAVGMHRGPLSTSGKFIVLRRNPHNVFESQFRVGFGENNRNPYRFAIFRESYEHAFSQLPNERVIELQYDDLPGAIPLLMNFIGIDNHGDWKDHKSSLGLAAESCYWMTDVTGDFQNKDPEKRKRLEKEQIASLELAMKLSRPLRPLMGPIRAHYDQLSIRRIFRLAKLELKNSR